MKLSKQSLMNALILATNKTASLMFAGAQNALRDGTLEIEGYERTDHLRDITKMADEWTKFDPDDPNTHPPCSAPVFGEPAFYLVRVHGQTQIAEWDNDYVSFLIDDYEAISHWRTLPKPPKETEEGKANL